MEISGGNQIIFERVVAQRQTDSIAQSDGIGGQALGSLAI